MTALVVSMAAAALLLNVVLEILRSFWSVPSTIEIGVVFGPLFVVVACFAADTWWFYAPALLVSGTWLMAMMAYLIGSLPLRRR